MRTWVTVPGAEIDDVAPERLDRVDDDEIGALALGKRRENVLDIGFSREQHVAVGGAQSLGAQAHLGDGFFTET